MSHFTINLSNDRSGIDGEGRNYLHHLATTVIIFAWVRAHHFSQQREEIFTSHRNRVYVGVTEKSRCVINFHEIGATAIAE